MTSNIGQTGVESIRLNGAKVEDLPIGEAARVQPQIELARDTERQNKINNVLAKYPSQRVDYLEGRIREAKTNQENMAKLAQLEQERIRDYQGHIEMCKHRDREIAKLDPENDKDQITALQRQYPYIIDRLQVQIDISTESIERFQEVVRRESSDIEEMGQVLGLCKQRDLELKNLGAQLATG